VILLESAVTQLESPVILLESTLILDESRPILLGSALILVESRVILARTRVILFESTAILAESRVILDATVRSIDRLVPLTLRKEGRDVRDEDDHPQGAATSRHDARVRHEDLDEQQESIQSADGERDHLMEPLARNDPEREPVDSQPTEEDGEDRAPSRT
jgi:hypothetical protein